MRIFDVLLLALMSACEALSISSASVQRPAIVMRVPVLRLSSAGDWMFTDVRRSDDGQSRELEAIVDPFGRQLLVGDESWQRVKSPSELLALDMAVRNASLIVHIPSATCSGTDGTVMRVLEVDTASASARLLAIGRCVVEGIATKTPRLRVRVCGKPDAPLDGVSLAEARDVAVATIDLWERSREVFSRVQDMQLRAKLRSLGGSASAALLSIPLEQQMELARDAGADRRLPSRTSVESGMDEAFGAGVQLMVALRNALAQQPPDALAFAPPNSGDVIDAVDAGALSSAQLSLLSFVALRLTRRTENDPDEFVEEQPDPRAPTVRQMQAIDTLPRLALSQRRLELRLAELQAQVSLLSLMDSDTDVGSSGRAE